MQRWPGRGRGTDGRCNSRGLEMAGVRACVQKDGGGEVSERAADMGERGPGAGKGPQAGKSAG